MHPTWTVARGRGLAIDPHRPTPTRQAPPRATNVPPQSNVVYPPLPGRTVRTIHHSAPKGEKIITTQDHNSPQNKEKLPNILVEVHNGESNYLALLVESREGGKIWVVANKEKALITVHREAINYVWPQHYLGQMYYYTAENISKLESICDNLVKAYKDHLKIAWGSYVDKSVYTITPEMLANFLFGQTPKPHEQYVAHKLLLQDDLYFERELVSVPNHYPGNSLIINNKLVFNCRALSEVTKVEKARKEQIHYNQYLDLFLHKARNMIGLETKEKSLIVDHMCKLTPQLSEKILLDVKNDKPFIDKIKEYALELCDDPEKVRRDILSPLKCGSQPTDAYNLLVKLRVLHKYQNPVLLKYSKKLEFTDTEVQKYDRLSEQIKAYQAQHSQQYSPAQPFHDQDKLTRKDMTHLKDNYAIDNDETDTEIDDCFAIETGTDGKMKVFVHIADPSRIVRPEDTLDKLARERVSSIFVPERSFSMFPSCISQSHFSLLPDKINYALTFIAHINKEGKLDGYEITPSTIQNVRSLTYKQVDHLFSLNNTKENNLISKTPLSNEQVQNLKSLYKIAEVRRSHRMSNGAVFVNLPMPSVSVKQNGEEIKVEPLNTSTPARMMVSEFMILVGEITADFAQKNNIPIPFRSQERTSTQLTLDVPTVMEDFKKIKELESNEPKYNNWLKNFMEQWNKRNKQLSARCSTEPKPHMGLALKAYCQATSPIRRYLDLLVHYQIKAVLRGDRPPFPKERVTKLITTLERSQQEINKLMSDSQRYWIMRFLENRSSSSLLLALVLAIQKVKDNGSVVQVSLLDLSIELGVTLKRIPKLGEILKLVVQSVDAVSNQISFRELSESPT